MSFSGPIVSGETLATPKSEETTCSSPGKSRPQSRRTKCDGKEDKNNNSNNDNANNRFDFVDIAEGTRHSLGLPPDGRHVYSWGRSTSLGQLGRELNETTTSNSPPGSRRTRPGQVPLPDSIKKVTRVFASVGSASDSGHSAIIDQDGKLWMTGCDRWQQLGLGSSSGGSTGYTWRHGKIWHERFTPSRYVTDLIEQTENLKNNDGSSRRGDGGRQTPLPSGTIRDVALGGDHTLVLSSNGNTYAFGKGGDGQLGLTAGKPFVSAPIKSPTLSHPDASAVCAIGACSIVLIGRDGRQNRMVGRNCRSQTVMDGLAQCIQTKRRNGLLLSESESESFQ
jgi:alpha-tubulin suppressor-like RCC1 family protein